ncbi:hypothetical protein LIA77_10377 [Sarocladium implicatum]|nr:hypothetical protein LIA77_10377 [Sarocladium implicatum]
MMYLLFKSIINLLSSRIDHFVFAASMLSLDFYTSSRWTGHGKVLLPVPPENGLQMQGSSRAGSETASHN